jgi:hypothetical protein
MTRPAGRWRLSRRALLRGAGCSLALPWLEVMAPARARAQASAIPPRALFVYFPSGYTKGHWQIGGAGGADFTLPALASALAPFQSKLTIVSGLSNAPAGVGGLTAGGMHARGTGCSLVASPLLETGFQGPGVSADQVIVQGLGQASCLSSLVLGVPNERIPSFSEEGYSSIFYNNISFTGPRSPVQKISSPEDLFLRLVTCPGFGPGRGDKRARFEQSVMSAVKDQATRLIGCAGQADRLRLQEYFTSVEELERRFRAPSAPAPASCRAPAAPPPPGTTLREGAAAMMDLAVLAFQCGLTRVGTLMMDGAFSRRNYGLPDIGGANYIHGLSHGEIGGEEADNPRWLKITAHYFQLFAHLLGKLDAVREGEGTLLDHSVVTLFSEFGDGNTHDVHQLPLILAGGASGRLRTGRHIAAAPGTPQANVLLDVIRAMGVARGSFGDSTGGVPGLSV